MAQSVEDKALVVIRNALRNATPAIPTTIGADSVVNLRPGTVQITPSGIDFDAARGQVRRWHWHMLVTYAQTFGSDGTNNTALQTALDFQRRVLDLLTPEALLTALRTAGAENVKRGPLAMWIKPGATTGSALGGVFRISVTFTG